MTYLAILPIPSLTPDDLPIVKENFDSIENVVDGQLGDDNMTPKGLTNASIADATVVTSLLGASAVTKAKTLLFVSAVLTGTGAQQSVAHGLGVVPAAVLASIQNTDNLATVSIAEGTHDATNLYFTVSTGATFKAVAWG